MSGVEKLARVLDPAESFTDTDGEMSLRVLSGKRLAERILADPGPLLEALAEAGVLRDQADAWDDGFDAGHQAARAVNPEWPGVPSNPYRPGTEESTDARA